MADQDDAGAHAGEFGLQPLDAGQVEVVGRFVQQQDVRFRRQHTSQGGAPGLAAGQFQRILATGQPKLFQKVGGAVAVGGGGVVQPRFDIIQRGGIAGKVGFLRQISDGCTGLGETAAGIGLDKPSGDAQQG